ncbi:uncharacterized protein LOC141628588 [Silene latifolia]|uniref:uncharacterized protein LOC141628588 n=1 Tax=Silene latifolia TaxID=37657 RepID=UPI003D779271
MDEYGSFGNLFLSLLQDCTNQLSIFIVPYVCSLVDHPATVCHFTWNNKQGDGLTWAKLDRILASPQWLSDIHSTATFLNTGVLDHSPCLESVKEGWSNQYFGSHIGTLFLKLKKLKRRAEMQVLFQRAKVQNLQLNDLSTRYFYSRLANRRVRNSIGSIQDKSGKLLQQVRVQEILNALKSIDRNKSPGIDGYSSGFLDAWNLVGHDFKAAVFEFFQTCTMPKAANSTLLVLIPKMETHLTVKDFRPIACCTTFYKVVSKLLANRLKQVLDSIIGPEQAAFMANMDIFDNTMLAHELVSKYGRAYLTSRCLLKVDIRKAFDSINWGFLKDSMLQLNFPSKFFDWIRACITSPYYSLLINGEVQGFFPGKCGLRQGDPLSPYLFVICMDVLSRLLRKLPRVVNFSYHPNCVQLNLTYLVFDDDLLVSTRGYFPSIQAVAHCLDQFSKLSGLYVNPAKTDLYMGGVADDVRNLILEATGFSMGAFPFRYLGLLCLMQESLKICINPTWTKSRVESCIGLITVSVMQMKELLLGLAVSPAQTIQQLEACTSHMRYDTNAVYDYIRARRAPIIWSSLVHGTGCHPKHSFTGIMVLNNGLPTVDRLMTCGLHLVNRCALCKCSCEDLPHLFFVCAYSRQVLIEIAHWTHLPLRSFSLAHVMQDFISTGRSDKHRASLTVTIYYVWKEINNRIFKGTKSSLENLYIVINKVVNL